METTVVQPGTAPAIFTTGHHGHGGHHDERFRETRVDADYRSLVAQGERYGTINGDRINAASTAGLQASCQTDRLVQGGFGGVHDRICDSTGRVIGALDRGFDAAALAACKLSDEVAESKLSTAVGFKDQIIAQNVGFSAASVLATTIGNASQVQATANFNLLTVQATENNYKVLLDAQKNAAAAQLEAQKNAAEAARQLAECCCKLEGQAAANLASITATVIAGNQKTTDLLNAQTLERQAERIRFLETQTLILTSGVFPGAPGVKAA
jgi:hypothetical protein